VLDGFGQMITGNAFRVGEVGDGARDFLEAVVGAGAHAGNMRSRASPSFTTKWAGTSITVCRPRNSSSTAIRSFPGITRLTTARRLHLPQRRLQLEARKQIIRKQRLGHPRHALPGRTFESNARQENLHVLDLFQMPRRNVLVLGQGTQAKPIYISGHTTFNSLPLLHTGKPDGGNTDGRLWPHRQHRLLSCLTLPTGA